MSGLGDIETARLVARFRILNGWRVEVDLAAKYKGQCAVDPEGKRATIYGWVHGEDPPAEYWLHEVLHVALAAFKAAPSRENEEGLVQDLCRLAQ